MKKISILLLTLMPLAALAGGPDLAYDSHRFYVGAGLGFSQGIHSIETNTIATDPDIVDLRSNNSYQNTSAAGDVFLGYGFNLQRIYLSAEIYGSSSGLHEAANSSTIILGEGIANKTTVKLNSAEFGADLRPGFLLTPTTLIYGRVGAAFNTMHVNSHNEDLNDDDFGSRVLNYENDHDVVGMRLGAGLEQKISDRFSVRGDYIYTYYGSIAMRANTPFVNSGIIIANMTRVKLTANTVLASIIYSFA